MSLTHTNEGIFNAETNGDTAWLKEINTRYTMYLVLVYNQARRSADYQYQLL